MNTTCPNINEIPRVQTPQGAVDLLGPVSSHCLRKLDFDKGLRNLRPADRQKEALINIAELPEGLVYTALRLNVVIGYVCFHSPNKYSRWSKHPRILEMGTIEVTPEWRKYKIASRLLELAFSNPILEKYIVITIEFYRHWDLKQARMGVWQYQKMLTMLLDSVGLKKTLTDDPCILEHPANVLLVRFGKQVGHADIKLFTKLQFENKQNSLNSL